MAGKFQLITELYAEAAGEMSRDREAWKGFLSSAGFNNGAVASGHGWTCIVDLFE